jgi:hypothetical protein
VAVDTRPAPVVTIVDPQHPGPVRDLLVTEAPPPVRLPLRPRERLLAAALLVLLLVAFDRARTLRTSQREAARLAGLHLVAQVTAGGPVLGRDSFMSLELAIDGTGDAALPVRRFHVDHGWRPTGTDPLAFGTDQRIFLRHGLDCDRRIELPERLTLRVVVGGSERSLVVPVAAPPDGLVAGSAEVCGHVPLQQSLLLVSSSGQEPLVLELANAGLEELTVDGLSADGFSFRGTRPLPLELAGRAPGVLRFRSLERYPLQLLAAVTDCARAQRSLLRGAGRAGLVHAAVHRDGEHVTTVLTGQGVEVLLVQKWVAACSPA